MDDKSSRDLSVKWGCETMREEMIASIPQKQQDTVLQVVLIHNDAGASHIELRCMTWGTGLGWYRQKTLTLNRDTARTLLRNLGLARSQVSAKRPRHSGRNVISLSDRTRREQTLKTPARHPQRA